MTVPALPSLEGLTSQELLDLRTERHDLQASLIEDHKTLTVDWDAELTKFRSMRDRHVKRHLQNSPQSLCIARQCERIVAFLGVDAAARTAELQQLARDNAGQNAEAHADAVMAASQSAAASAEDSQYGLAGKAPKPGVTATEEEIRGDIQTLQDQILALTAALEA